MTRRYEHTLLLKLLLERMDALTSLDFGLESVDQVPTLSHLSRCTFMNDKNQS